MSRLTACTDVSRCHLVSHSVNLGNYANLPEVTAPFSQEHNLLRSDSVLLLSTLTWDSMFISKCFAITTFSFSQE